VSAQPVDKRSARALDLTETAGQWRHLITRDGEPVVAMPSQTVKGLYYLVTETSCTCLDWQQHGLRNLRIGDLGLHTLCKHIRAAAFVRIMAEEREQEASGYAF
jgi:hypothetical protein